MAQARRLGRREIAVVVISVLLIVVFLVMAALRYTADARSDDDAGSSPTPAPTGQSPEDETAGEAETVDSSELSWDFVSPSGNIGCSVDDEHALCGIATMQYQDAVPAAEQEACDGLVGHLVEVTADGATLVCDASGEAPVIEGEEVLDYGTDITVEGFTCFSDETGMSCRHLASGYSFSVARAGYELF